VLPPWTVPLPAPVVLEPPAVPPALELVVGDVGAGVAVTGAEYVAVGAVAEAGSDVEGGAALSVLVTEGAVAATVDALARCTGRWRTRRALRRRWLLRVLRAERAW
jgi:hypothetical protein